METPRSHLGRWYHEQIDPTGDMVADIVTALRKINPAAAEMFIQLLLSPYWWVTADCAFNGYLLNQIPPNPPY
jgi:hypothetical protein